MRRRLLALFVPVIAASVAAPVISAASDGPSAVAKPALTSHALTSHGSGKAPATAEPASRRWL